MQEGLRAAPGAAVSQLGPAELRVARLKDFEGTSWHVESHLLLHIMRHMSHMLDVICHYLVAALIFCQQALQGASVALSQAWLPRSCSRWRRDSEAGHARQDGRVCCENVEVFILLKSEWQNQPSDL